MYLEIHVGRYIRRENRKIARHINEPERFHELPEDERDAIRAWVRENLVRRRKRLSSYALKHMAEKALGAHVGNGEMKGAMLEAGYKPINTTRKSGINSRKNEINFYFQAGPRDA